MEKRKNIIVGAFVIGCGAVLIGLLVMLQQLNLFNHSYTLNVEFKNIGTITTGTPVLLNGVQVGKVSEIALDNTSNDVIVTLAINNGVEIRKGAQFRIVMKGIMGDSRINVINPAKGSEIYAPGSSIMGSDTISMDTLIQNLNTSILLFNSIAGKVNSLPFEQLSQAMVQLNSLMEQLNTTTVNANNLILNSNQVVTNVNGLINQNKGEITQILNNLTAVMNNLQSMTGSENQAAVQSVIEQTDLLIRNLNELLESSPSSGASTPSGSSIPLKSTIRSITAITKRMSKVLDNDVNFNVTAYGVGGVNESDVTNGSNAIGDMELNVKNRETNYYLTLGGSGVFNNQLKGTLLLGKYSADEKGSLGIGAINNYPGIQMTYQYTPHNLLKLSAYNFQNGKVQLINQYQIGNYNFNIIGRSDQVYGAGVGYTF